MLLEGKVALITGAARGIGRSIAVAFAGEGARAIVTGRDMERLTRAADEIRAGGGEAEAFVLDVTRQEDAVRVVEQVIGKWGRIDLLVNNAGIITYHTPVWATTMGAVGRGDEYKPAGDPPDVPRGLTAHDAAEAGRHHQHRGHHPVGCPMATTEPTRRLSVALLATQPPWVTLSVPTASASMASIPTGWILIWPGPTILTETLTG